MRIREIVAVLCLGLVTMAPPAAAQRTRDQARLIFTVSGAYIDGTGLWSVPRQPINNVNPADTLALSRSIGRTLSGGFSATLYPKEYLGFTADALLLGLGFDDACQEVRPAAFPTNRDACGVLDGQSRSAAAVVLSVGTILRLYSREFISPFARATAGALISNLSSTRTEATTSDGTLLVIYDDETQTRVKPAFGLGLGVTVALGKAYHLRTEVRDNIVGVERVSGATSSIATVPPRNTVYKHLFSILLGLDVILERDRGRRY